MTTTPQPQKPTGKFAFALKTIARMEERIQKLEAENARLREALKDLLDHYAEYGSDPYYWKETNAITDKAHTALENKQ